MPIFIVGVMFLPLYLLSIKILHKYGQLTENRFGLLAAAYFSVMTLTAFYLFPTASAGRIIGHVLAFLCWFPGYLIAKWIYRRIFLHDKKE